MDDSLKVNGSKVDETEVDGAGDGLAILGVGLATLSVVSFFAAVLCIRWFG